MKTFFFNLANMLTYLKITETYCLRLYVLLDLFQIYSFFFNILVQDVQNTKQTKAFSKDVEVPTQLILWKVITYIKEKATDKMKDVIKYISSIDWVLTVPASWDDIAKTVFRNAALKVSYTQYFDSDQVS